MCGSSDSDKAKKALYLGNIFCGKTHDYTMLKSEFDTGLGWFTDHHVRIDLGYLGFDKEFASGDLSLPIKSSKTKPLSDEAKSSNRSLASQRIVVEHVIGGMKRYRVLSNRIRSRNWSGYDVKLEVCAGLWNFYITN